MAWASKHLNGNIMAAVDIETTGLDIRQHDIWQICILPLDSNLQRMKEVQPFYLMLQPQRPENVDPKAISRQQLADALVKGVHPDTAENLLDSWFKKINLPVGKKICPLACNWPFDRNFLQYWLGPTMFEEIFHAWYRDIMVSACYANDKADINNVPYPYPKCSLNYLCACLKVHNDSPHDALADCVATAECYRRMLRERF